jgi:phosphatidate cytidylyltransferase
MSTITKRIFTALSLAVAFLCVLFFAPIWYVAIFLSVSLLIALFEWCAFARLSGALSKSVCIIVGMSCMLLMYRYIDSELVIFAGLLVAVSVWVLALVCLLLWTGRISRPVIIIAGFLFLLPAWISAERIVLSKEYGVVLLFLLFWIVAAADIGAYFFGNVFGRHRLLPRVSPGKTFEGALGGLTCSTLAAFSGIVLVDWSLTQAMVIGFFIGVISVLGDLTVSLFKRNVGLKDSGYIFPGHGGMLDRIDGVIAAMPLYLALLLVFGKLPEMIAV